MLIVTCCCYNPSALNKSFAKSYVADVLQHGMVVVKQCGYETFIAPALMINNIAMFAQMYVTCNYCTAVYTIAMAVVLYRANVLARAASLEEG